MNIRSERSRGSDDTTMARISDYEDVRRDRTGWPNSAIDTKKNIAYGQAQTVLTTLPQ